MNPFQLWPDARLATALYEERLREAAQARRRAGSQPFLLPELHLWAGDQLIRLGNWLKSRYPESANAAAGEV
jgi:hypothetical protein